jgi:5-methylcytosine-specific restriction enzyme A
MRRSPIKRGKPLARKTPLVNKKPLQAKSAPKNRGSSTGPSSDVVDAVAERASHSCEICGCVVGPERGTDFHIHHRRPRAMGGTGRPDTNLPSNLLLLCPEDHRWAESDRTTGLAAGWLVPQRGDPAQVAVILYGPRRVYLTADGRYSPHPPRREKGGTDAHVS